MRRILIVISLVLLFTVGSALSAQSQPRIAVGDLLVQSANPAHKYVGKGLTELIAVELVKSRRVLLVEREKRAQLLDELEFSLSDAADPTKAAELGRLLSADYLAIGEFVDMDSQVMISLKLVKVDTGAIVWADSKVEMLVKYDLIAKFFSSSLLNAMVPSTVSIPAVAAEPAVKKDETALIAFSEAIDSVDRGDKKQAKKKLEEARKKDPGNDAIAYYLAKLGGSTPRFAVEIDPMAGSYNPAGLAFEDKLRVFNWDSFLWPVSSGREAWNYDRFYPYIASSRVLNVHAGAIVPLSKKVSLLAEAHFVDSFDHIGNLDTSEGNANNIAGNIDQTVADVHWIGAVWAGLLGLGLELSPGLAAGASVRAGAYVETPDDNLNIYDWGRDAFSLTVDAGLIYRIFDGRFQAEARFIWSPDRETWGNVEERIIEEGKTPILASLSAVGGLLDQKLFISGRVAADIYYDERDGFFLRGIPALEYWISDKVAVRGGYEFAYLSLLAQTATGHGGMAGISLKLGAFDLDLNAAYRQKPVRLLPGEIDAYLNLLMGLSLKI